MSGQARWAQVFFCEDKRRIYHMSLPDRRRHWEVKGGPVSEKCSCMPHSRASSASHAGLPCFRLSAACGYLASQCLHSVPNSHLPCCPAGLTPPYKHYEPALDGYEFDWRWAVGATPWGPYSNYSGVSELMQASGGDTDKSTKELSVCLCQAVPMQEASTLKQFRESTCCPCRQAGKAPIFSDSQ